MGYGVGGMNKLQESIDTLINLNRSDYKDPEEIKLFWTLIAKGRYCIDLASNRGDYTGYINDAIPEVVSVKIEVEDEMDGSYHIHETVAYSDNRMNYDTYPIARVDMCTGEMEIDWFDESFKDHPDVLALIKKVPEMEDKSIMEDIKWVIKDAQKEKS